VLYTEEWVCDIVLIECTSSLGKTQEGSGFRREGYKGPMGDKGSLFMSNLGLRWTIPVTAGGSQVSKRGIQQGEYSKGKCAMYSCVFLTRVRVHIGMIELMKDTSCMYDNNNQNECC
jgi:hypothetical protein